MENMTATALPLGIITGTTSANQKKVEKEWNSRTLRFALQSVARELTTDKRTVWCMRRVLPGANVEVWKKDGTGKAFYKNLFRCNKLWACPVCSMTIAQKKHERLKFGLANWNKGVLMTTYTVQHNKGDRCAATLKELTDAYSKSLSGRQFQNLKEKYGLLESVRAIEITYGSNGFHPHIHTLWLCENYTHKLTADLEMELLLRWQNLLPDTNSAGVDVSDNGDTGEYVTKLSTWGVMEEITLQPIKKGKKKGKTITQLLYDFMMGDEKAGSLWREATEALAGKKQLAPSRGFWDLLNVGEPDETAEEPVCEYDDFLAKIDPQTWRFICSRNARGALLEGLERGISLHEFMTELYKKGANHTG